ncbi:hypothetical protein RN001_007094 [Aquatica leii]|uniref:Uncharacterized protein n=1 Tax=Aquatica leii TaxID=1421715 RepID=A0AAN7P957_9COLE|nr:hypothetical protein RN001_007094 [Aquatica leii]
MLRLVVFTFVFICANATQLQLNPATVRIFESQINDTLNNLSKDLAKNDPMTIPTIDFAIANPGVTVNLSAQNVQLIGYSQFVATKIKVNVIPPSLELNLVFKKIQLIAPSYNLNLQAAFIPFYGAGSINLVPENIQIGVKAKVSIGISGITVKEVQPTFNLTKSDLVITGALNNPQFSQIVSTSTTECFPQFLKNYTKKLSALLGPVIQDVLNKLLSDLLRADHFIPIPGTIKTQEVQQDGLIGRLNVHF